jgi:hypothetical protein
MVAARSQAMSHSFLLAISNLQHGIVRRFLRRLGNPCFGTKKLMGIVGAVMQRDRHHSSQNALPVIRVNSDRSIVFTCFKCAALLFISTRWGRVYIQGVATIT